MTPDPQLARWQVLACLILLVVAAGVVRGRGLRTSVYGDEGFHFAVADRHAAGQGLTLAPGVPYTRALPFSWAVIACRSAFGDSEWAQRLPAFLASLGCVVLLFAIGARWFTPAVGLLAAAILALDFQSVFFGSYARFYSTAQFFSLLAVYGFQRGFAAVEGPAAPSWARASAWAAVAGASLLAGLSLQIVTVAVGLGAVVFLVARAILRWCEGRRDWSRWPEVRILGAAGLLVAVEVILARPTRLLAALTHVPLWNAREELSPFYYLSHLRAAYPFESLLAAVGALFALSWRPRGALLAISFSLPPLLAHSLLPQKVMRYIFLLLPYVFLLTACGYVFLFRGLRELVPSGRGRLGSLSAAGLVGLLLMLSPAASTGGRAGRGASWVDWRAGVARVAGQIQPSDAIVAGVGDDLFAITQYTGRADAHVCAPQWRTGRLADQRRAADNGRGPYGIPCLSTVPAFQELAARHGRAWVFLRSDHVNRGESKIAPVEVLNEVVERGTRMSRAGAEVTVILLENGQ